MNHRTRSNSIGPRGVLFLAAFFATVAALTLLSSGGRKAQAQPPPPPESNPVPAAPQLIASVLGGNVVELNWTSVSGAVRYGLWVWVGSDWVQLDDGALTGTNFSHSDPSAETTYKYIVRAVSANGTPGAWSNIATVTTGESQPAPPGSDQSVPPESPQLGYTPVPPEYGQPGHAPPPPGTAQASFVPPHPNPTSNLPATSTATSTPTRASTSTPTLTPTPTPTSTSTPTLTPTPEPTATPTATASALLAPGLTAEATERGVELKWEAAAGAVRYELMTWWDGKRRWQRIGGANLTGTRYMHEDVEAGTRYSYTIRAVNAAGEKSDWLRDYPSAVAVAVTEAEEATPTPTATASALLAPGLTVEATERGVELKWEAAAGAVRYELITWRHGAKRWQRIGGANLTGTTYRHRDVEGGTNYYYTIRAVNAAGEKSDWLSEYPSATALATDP